MESIDYKTLLEISQSTATVRTRDELQAFIDDRVRPCFGFNKVWNICLYKPVPNTLEVLFTNKITPQDSDAYMRFRQPDQAEGFFKIIIETDEIFHLDECWESVPKTTRIEKNAYQYWQDFNIKYCLSVLLRSFDQVIGTFHTFFREHKTFTESQLQLFKSLAAQIAVALVNVLANEKALEREREKDLLLSISEEMAPIRSRADLWRVMTEKIKPMLEFDDAVVIVLSEDQTRYSHFLGASTENGKNGGDDSLSVGPMLPVSGTPHEYLLTLPSPHVLEIENLLKLCSDSAEAYLGLETDLRRLVGFQLQWGDRLSGLLQLAVRNREQLPESKFDLYKAIANQMVVAVGTILANEEIALLTDERRRRAEELAKSNEAIARHFGTLKRAVRPFGFPRSSDD